MGHGEEGGLNDFRFAQVLAPAASHVAAAPFGDATASHGRRHSADYPQVLMQPKRVEEAPVLIGRDLAPHKCPRPSALRARHAANFAAGPAILIAVADVLVFVVAGTERIRKMKHRGSLESN
jgi:hypothetical protein